MCNLIRFLVALILISVPTGTYADTVQSTRVIDPNQYACTGGDGYPYRRKSEYVLKELDLKVGDVVVDIGAGDGWWAEKMAKFIGSEGTIHASEVAQKKVDKMKEKFADLPQIKPYLCPTDSTGLTDNSCDLAFLSIAGPAVSASGGSGVDSCPLRVDYRYVSFHCHFRPARAFSIRAIAKEATAW